MISSFPPLSPHRCLSFFITFPILMLIRDRSRGFSWKGPIPLAPGAPWPGST